MLYTKGDMKGGFNKTPYRRGFTIIEVMIFLAISGVMFLVAADFINGKEAQAEYTQGMNNANSTIQTIINDVSNGNYPIPLSGLSFPCGGIAINIGHSLTPVDGTAGCSFIGKVLVPEDNSVVYSLLSVAGCQFFVSGISGCSPTPASLPLNLQEEAPTVISQDSITAEWPGGMQVTKLAYYTGGNWHSTGAIGFIGSLPNKQNGGLLQSGSQPTSIVIFPNSSLADPLASIISDINSIGSSGSSGQLLGQGYVLMCFIGLNNERGSLTIGSQSGGAQITTDLRLGQAVSPSC